MNSELKQPVATYTSDWFTPRKSHWRRHVVPRFRRKASFWLEVGSYEGRSALWTLDHVLRHPDSRIVCVDCWDGPFEATFDSNVAAHPRKGSVRKLKGQWLSVLARCVVESGEAAPQFDGIYIDADHQAKSVLAQAALCWSLLKRGGLLIFDDYRWQHPDDESRRSKLPPKPGIDAFLSCWRHELRLIHKGWQVMVEKV